ncbi:hypothetical protein C0995_000223, partial [Termitomyces sp. Mi166
LLHHCCFHPELVLALLSHSEEILLPPSNCCPVTEPPQPPMGPTGNTTPLDSQQLTLAWSINGLGLGAAPQGPEAPPSLGYSLAYGFLPFSMGNIGNLGGSPPLNYLPGPHVAAPPNWLLGRLSLGSRAPEGVFLGRPLNSGPPSRWEQVISVFLPHSGTENHYYYYYNASAPI